MILKLFIGSKNTNNLCTSCKLLVLKRFKNNSKFASWELWEPFSTTEPYNPRKLCQTTLIGKKENIDMSLAKRWLIPKWRQTTHRTLTLFVFWLVKIPKRRRSFQNWTSGTSETLIATRSLRLSIGVSIATDTNKSGQSVSTYGNWRPIGDPIAADKINRDSLVLTIVSRRAWHKKQPLNITPRGAILFIASLWCEVICYEKEPLYY